MKPRLRFRYGTWACARVEWRHEYPFMCQPIGVGYTPLQAYEEWEVQLPHEERPHFPTAIQSEPTVKRDARMDDACVGQRAAAEARAA